MKILIIEDEYSLADAISDSLQKENFETKIITNGEDGEDEALTEDERTETKENQNNQGNTINGQNGQQMQGENSQAQGNSQMQGNNNQGNMQMQGMSTDSTTSEMKSMSSSTNMQTASISGTATSGNSSSTSMTSSKTTYNGSNNNYLSSLSITGITLSPDFIKENSTYFATVTDASDLEVNATAEDSDATVKITGNTGIKEGTNKILITVTAENGDIRYYRIFVNYNTKTNSSKVTTSAEVASALEENVDLHTGYYLEEVYVEENQFVSKGENILKYSNGTYLTAPYDCYISSISLPDEGSQITSDNYVKIQSKNALSISVNVSEKNVANVDVGDKATIKIKSLDKEYTGYVTYVSNTASNSKFEVVINFVNDGDIKIGMSSSVTIE